MEDESTTSGAVDSIDALRMQLESSLSLAFDFGFDIDSATTSRPEKVDGLNGAVDDVDSFPIKSTTTTTTVSRSSI
jgi:hypothetical protein